MNTAEFVYIECGVYYDIYVLYFHIIELTKMYIKTFFAVFSICIGSHLIGEP